MELSNLKIKKIFTYIFMLVPAFSATISAIHLVNFLNLGNIIALSISIAIIFEIANIAILLLILFMKQKQQIYSFTIFIILIFLQILGNVYYSYNFMSEKLAVNPHYIDNYVNMISYMIEADMNFHKFWLSFIVGTPIPLTALILTKVVSDWIKEGEIMGEKPKINIDNIENKYEKIKNKVSSSDIPNN